MDGLAAVSGCKTIDTAKITADALGRARKSLSPKIIW